MERKRVSSSNIRSIGYNAQDEILCQTFDPGERLAKNPLLIAEILRLAWEEGKKPSALTKLVESLTSFVDA